MQIITKYMQIRNIPEDIQIKIQEYLNELL